MLLYNEQKAQLENEVVQLKIGISKQKREAVEKEQAAEQVVNRQRKEIDDLQKQLKHLTPLSQTDNVVKKVCNTHKLYIYQIIMLRTYNNTVLMNMIW